ncbi:methyltransferase domain-containing protein [Candidatus Bathyarchaeota archaeon]|nr:MAG: methyltransferase domain-containing protein [Candidatus Bathyarchaeota archaeon]
MRWSITDPESLEHAIFELKLRVVRWIGVHKGMTILDVGCGQGGFTASLAKIVGEAGKVIAIDVTNEYLDEFIERLNRYGVKNTVTFVQADATNLKDEITDDFAHMVVSFRLLEELKRCEDMPRVVREMVRAVKNGGKVCLVELSSKARNKAEETYIRLHMESGDCFFESKQIAKSMKTSGLAKVYIEQFDSNIWFSPLLAKQELSFAQVWYDSDVEKRLGPLIDKYGMKYPKLLIFSGQKPANRKK